MLKLNCDKYRPLSSEDKQVQRRERFKLQRVAANVLGGDAQKKMEDNNKDYESDIHRVCGCMWTPLADNIELMLSTDNQTAHVKNVMTCGDVWVCPICSAKVQERRREEMAKAMEQWHTEGRKVLMVTLTAPHYNHQTLSDLRAMQSKALTALRKSSGSYVRFLKEKQGYKGLIRSLEVTISRRNGWHLHTHELWFVKSDADVDLIKEKTLKRWESACAHAGLLNVSDEAQMRVFHVRSVDIKDAFQSSHYLAKMATANHWEAEGDTVDKAIKQSGYCPFDLLGEVLSKGKHSQWCKKRFIEYANGMKGARQLFWSKGLKAYFEIDKKAKRKSSKKPDDMLIKVRTIDKSTWNQIAKLGARAELYNAIERDDKNALNAFLESYEKSP